MSSTYKIWSYWRTKPCKRYGRLITRLQTNEERPILFIPKWNNIKVPTIWNRRQKSYHRETSSFMSSCKKQVQQTRNISYDWLPVRHWHINKDIVSGILCWFNCSAYLNFKIAVYPKDMKIYSRWSACGLTVRA